MLQKKLKIKDINLLDAYKKKKEPSKYASIMKFIVPPIVLALIVFGTFGYLTFKNNSIQNDINEVTAKTKALQKKIASDPNLSKANSLQDIYANTEKLKQLYEDLQSYPELTQAAFDQLIISAGTKTTISTFAYSRESQAISLTIKSENASDTEQFIRNLKASDKFSNVSYTGYTGGEEETNSTTDNKTTGTTTTTQETAKKTSYTASVECVLK